jgi:mono/diheme cytochrome c family protein
MRETILGLALLLAAGTARADAAAVFQEQCAICHGKDGKGSIAGKKMGATDLTAVAGSEAEIARSVAQGKGRMRPFEGRLTKEQIAALARYVKRGLK